MLMTEKSGFTLALVKSMKNHEKQLWASAKFGTFLLGWVPFIRLIAVNGSLALSRLHRDSDIDFFIITKKNRLWTARFFSLLLLDLFFLRAKDDHRRGKICLNHLLSDKDYVLTPQNKYNAHQYSNLVILYQAPDVYQKFIARNLWMKRYYPAKKSYCSATKTNLIQTIKEFLFARKFGDILEKKFYTWQVARIRKNPFFHRKDSLLKISKKEFYYYTGACQKYQNFRQKP